MAEKKNSKKEYPPLEATEYKSLSEEYPYFKKRKQEK